MSRLIAMLGKVKERYEREEVTFEQLLEMEKDKQAGVLKLKKRDVKNILYEQNKQTLIHP